MSRAGAAASQGQEEGREAGGVNKNARRAEGQTRQSKTTHYAIIELDMIAGPNQSNRLQIEISMRIEAAGITTKLNH